jgi:uncharacterized protein with HEPN domain
MSDEIIFDICKNHLPKLRKTIQKMLNLSSF